MVVVHSYDYRHEAELGKSVLEANSVQAVISADDVAGLNPMIGAGTGGVRLLVRRSDERKAKKILG